MHTYLVKTKKEKNEQQPSARMVYSCLKFIAQLNLFIVVLHVVLCDGISTVRESTKCRQLYFYLVLSRKQLFKTCLDIYIYKEGLISSVPDDFLIACKESPANTSSVKV